MASGSSPTDEAYSVKKARRFNVFLSFSGLDCRHSFTDNLYHTLIQRGISTFIYDERIEEVEPEMEKAIKASRASIVVLSKNYATSSWCLDELLLILKQRRECNHIVVPVFYQVDPADVRNLRGAFDIEAKPCSESWTDENVHQWREALREVAQLQGEVANGPETSFLKEIVDKMCNKLDSTEVYLSFNVGMVTRYMEINSWLEQRYLYFLVIFGMGGSGKTTLANYIYRLNLEKFESVSFLEDVGRRCETSNGLLELQKQLLNDILGEKWRNISGVSQAKFMIGEMLQRKRVLIVIDDIVGHSQLVDLLGTGRIHPMSKIIVTTREHPDNLFDLSNWSGRRYEMRLLNDEESLELLCAHAYGSKIPMAGFEELVLQAVQYCEGNPLALKVLGLSFSKNTIQNCESQLRLLEKHIDSKIYDVLIRSFDSLPSYTKDLFLHIACFFVGKDMDYAVKILKRDFTAIYGIQILINKCLLTISPNKKLMMHRLHQEMGKQIVFQESHAKRSRVWLNSDSYKQVDIYNITDHMSNSSFGDQTGAMTSVNRSELTDDSMEEIYDKQYKSRDETVGDIISTLDEITMDESDSHSHVRRHVEQYSISPLSRKMDSATGQAEKLFSSTSTHQFRIFSLTEIKSSTDDFADELIIGKGGFGIVYKGQISCKDAGHLVAIKRLDPMSIQGEVEFRAEIDALRKLRHCHFVSLIGYCDTNQEKVLVYDYMPNGTLYDHLHKAHTPLSWVARLKIAIGAARGMDYLHTGVGTQYGVIHRDVKSTNILLDANWAAMVSDFGLSRIGPTNQSDSYVRSRVKGTFGYLDPFYFNTGKLTRKTDVYAFGVVLFELLSGRPAVDPQKDDDQCSLITWAKVCVKQKKFDQLVDPNIKGTISTKCLQQFAQMAARCVHDVMKERPTMSDLVASLQSLLELQEKSNRATESSGLRGFPWKIHKYFGPSTKLKQTQAKVEQVPKITDEDTQQHDE